MSSYFDTFRKEVGELSRECPNNVEGMKSFLFGLMKIESRMILDCEYFAGDIETPQDVRDAIMTCIWTHRANYAGQESIDDLTKATSQDAVCRSSKLESEMHSLWHDIARMRYQMRYGPISDDPAWAVQRRDAWVDKQQGKRHPWQKNPPTAGDEPIRFSDYRPPVKVARESQEDQNAKTSGQSPFIAALAIIIFHEAFWLVGSLL